MTIGMYGDIRTVGASRIRVPLAANQRLLFNNSGAVGQSAEFYVVTPGCELHVGDGATAQGVVYLHSQGSNPGGLALQSGAFYALMVGATLTGTRTHTMPDITGTVHVAPTVVADVAPLYSAGYPLYFIDDAVTPHYWSAHISSAGAWVITDLGTTPP